LLIAFKASKALQTDEDMKKLANYDSWVQLFLQVLTVTPSSMFCECLGKYRAATRSFPNKIVQQQQQQNTARKTKAQPNFQNFTTIRCSISKFKFSA
jgi:hypothetical protein